MAVAMAGITGSMRVVDLIASWQNSNKTDDQQRFEEYGSDFHLYPSV
jgi:hypothetical protein